MNKYIKNLRKTMEKNKKIQLEIKKMQQANKQLIKYLKDSNKTV